MNIPAPTPLMIGKVASLYDITVQTLRHYDKIGLFRPEITNPETGYRYYSVQQLRDLETILFLRQLQLSLTEIQEAMDALSRGGNLLDVLQRRDEELQEQISALQRMRDTITGISRIEKPDHPLGQVFIDHFSPPRHFLFHPLPGLDVHRADFPHKLMDARKALLGSLPSIQTEYSFGATVSMEHFSSTGALAFSGVLLDPGLYGVAPPPGMMEFPEGHYAVITIDRENAPPELAYQKLITFVREHRFETDDNILEMPLDPSFSSISRMSRLISLQVRLHF